MGERAIQERMESKRGSSYYQLEETTRHDNSILIGSGSRLVAVAISIENFM